MILSAYKETSESKRFPYRITLYQLAVAAGPPWGSARELSLSPLTRRGDPPPLLAPGRVTPLRHILGVKLVLLWGRCYGKRVVLTIRKRASTPPFTQEVPVAGALSAAAFAGGVGGINLGAWR